MKKKILLAIAAILIIGGTAHGGQGAFKVDLFLSGTTGAGVDVSGATMAGDSGDSIFVVNGETGVTVFDSQRLNQNNYTFQFTRMVAATSPYSLSKTGTTNVGRIADIEAAGVSPWYKVSNYECSQAVWDSLPKNYIAVNESLGSGTSNDVVPFFPPASFDYMIIGVEASGISIPARYPDTGVSVYNIVDAILVGQ